MIVSTHIDAGLVWSADIAGDAVTFDLRPGQRSINVLLLDVPAALTIHLLMDKTGAPFVTNQGILLSDDGITFRAEPVTQTGEDRWSITVSPKGTSLRVATRQVYGRDAVDRLLCDLHGHPRIRPRMLTRDHRSLVMFECGEDDGRKPVHYVIAGEDVTETPGSIVADHMLRLLAAGETDLLDRAVVRVIPVASLYCAGRPSSASYNTLAGASIYGAATWGKQPPPPEFAIIRDLVEETIAQRRLGLLLTIHCWHATHDFTGIEFVQTGGDNTLTPDREAAALAAMKELMTDVPHRREIVSNKCWCPGLARDYLMAKHNVVSFRVEITTIQNPTNDYLPPARAFVRNMAAVKDWSFVQPA